MQLGTFRVVEVVPIVGDLERHQRAFGNRCTNPIWFEVVRVAKLAACTRVPRHCAVREASC